MSAWISVNDRLPKNTDDVLVSDGYGSYAVAWFSQSDMRWFVSNDMLEAENYDGRATIRLDASVMFWAEIAQTTKL